MKSTVVLISEQGRGVAQRAASFLGAEIIRRSEVQGVWESLDCIVFVGAMGICVRTIAPLVEDKHTDPAVVCVDSGGHNVVSVLSGHVGGANEIASKLALELNAHPVITTQTDGSGLWPLDLLAKRFGWAQESDDINPQIFLYAEGKPAALLLEVQDEGTKYLEENPAGNIEVFHRFEDVDLSRFSLLLSVSPIRRKVGIPSIQWVPRCVHVGIGLARQAGPVDKVIKEIFKCLSDNGICREAIASISSADIKKEEPVVKALEKEFHTNFFSAESLSSVVVPTPSQVVEKCVGTPSVSEASAILSSNNGSLLLSKQKGANWTVAAAVGYEYLMHPHIEIVGAGPGDPDLVSVRGRKMLQKADLILYAGSLVPKELTLCAKPGATVVSSAGMDLEQQCELMKDFYDRGKFIVRLHTGDPCIFGAIQEQMAFFDKNGMSYHITPGISSFLAAAAELRSQFTIPEKCQTIILTRGEGRTPMPEKEKLHLLARSNSTMCIFLSAAIVDDVQKELLMEYPEDTPVAACYHLTWPDQKIYRGVLKDLAKIVKDNSLTLTTMLVVGDSIDNRKGLSELYSKNFTHLFRKARV
ncbi:MAG: precorrin-4 C(11)-methyltransferase, partial [Bacteroidales bacterium]|nr:precorrin-4 C(11)-methyltransferase [Bacteroidales bacterium]